MENPMTFQQHYADHQRQSAWINAHDWQFQKPEQRHPVRRALGKGLIALAVVLSPSARRETQAA